MVLNMLALVTEGNSFAFPNPSLITHASKQVVKRTLMGEEVMAWVVLKPDETATEEEIIDFCRGQIAHYKVPRHIKFVSEFSMTVTGKIQKFRMREIAIEELGLQQEVRVATV